MKSQVKCRLCGAMIDRDSSYQDKDRRGFYFCNSEHFIEYGKKVAQKSINSQVSMQPDPKERARLELIDYVYLLYDKNIPAFVFKQIKDFATRKQKPLTYKGMELSLRYWVDTLGNSFDGDTGIGIVEYVYDDAERFWQDKQRIIKASYNMKQDNVVQKSACKSSGEVLKYMMRRGGKNV